MIQTLRAYRAGEPLGDVVVLKLDALSAPSQDTLRKLEKIRGYAPAQDLAALRAYPPHSLGREYARHLDANGIEPLVVSDAVRQRFRDNPYALRYTATHDLHHVLTGFDTGLAGEAGVVAFNVGQGSAPIGRATLWWVRVLYALLSPSQARRIWHDIRVGLALGRRAELVIAEPIESWFGEPLAEVRARLRIPDPHAAGVLASGRSRVADFFYPKKRPSDAHRPLGAGSDSRSR
jgi:ubiquinone biosynthesis protein Coq4